MKRILFVIPTLGQGGAEKVLVNLVNHMNKELFDVTVLTLFDVGVNKSFLNKDVHYKSVMKKQFIGNTWFLKLFSPTFLYKKIVKERYDIIVSYLEGPTARIVSGCDDKDTKLVSWIHCTMHSMEEVSKPFRNTSEAQKCYNQFHAMVYVSEACKEAFQKVCHTEGLQMVLYNSNDSTLIQYKMKEEIDDACFKQYEFTWCGVGKLIPVKGFDRMLRIQKKLISDGKKTHLLILGDGPLRKKLEKWCEIHGIESCVTFLGYQKNPYKYMRRCDLFVCSSLSEGFSTAATEALILGIPVCTVDVSGMKEMLGENNEFGIITENNTDALYQGIKRLLDDQKLLLFYREKAKERGKSFSTKKTVYAVEQMLRNL